MRIAESGRGIGTTTSVFTHINRRWLDRTEKNAQRSWGTTSGVLCDIVYLFGNKNISRKENDDVRISYWIERFKLTKIWRPSETPSVQMSGSFRRDRMDVLTDGGSKIIVWGESIRLNFPKRWPEQDSSPKRIIFAASFDTSDPDIFMAMPKSACNQGYNEAKDHLISFSYLLESRGIIHSITSPKQPWNKGTAILIEGYLHANDMS